MDEVRRAKGEGRRASETEPKLVAVILAAGRSTRMGSSKPLLRLGSTTFLGRLMSLYGGLGIPQRVVLGPDWVAVSRIQPVPEEVLLVNPRPERGPLSSLCIGLGALPAAVSGIFLHPVDHPLVRPETIMDLAALHRQQPERILIPAFEGTGGHPTVFPSPVFAELQRAPLDQGARFVVQTDPQRVITVEFDDPGILRNIDTPEDYARWVGRP